MHFSTQTVFALSRSCNLFWSKWQNMFRCLSFSTAPLIIINTERSRLVHKSALLLHSSYLWSNATTRPDITTYLGFFLFYVRLLDYSILLKARHDELIHESITLRNHELILRKTLIMRSQLKNERGHFFPAMIWTMIPRNQ